MNKYREKKKGNKAILSIYWFIVNRPNTQQQAVSCTSYLKAGNPKMQCPKFNINRMNSKHCSMQRRGGGGGGCFSVLALWLCRLKLASTLIFLTWSHGEADVNKMEISVMQQLAVVNHCSDKKDRSRWLDQFWWVRKQVNIISILQPELEVRI